MATFPARLDAEVSSEVAASLGRSLVHAEHHPWGSKNMPWAVCELIDGRSGYEAESASGFQETLRTLTLLRLLETADHFRLTQPEKYPSWATRIETELDRIT